MFSSPVFYAWLVWLLALAVFAVIRHKSHQREEQQREERRRQREAERGQHSSGALRRQMRRSALPPDYRDQLIATGIIRPATEPDLTPDPATSI